MNLSRLMAQIVKELLSLLRDPRARAILIAPPLLQLFIFSFAATLEVRNASVALFNEDNGVAAREFAAAIGQAGFVSNLLEVHDRDAQQALLDEGEVLLAVHIPADYSRKLQGGQTAQVQVLLDGRHANTAQVALSYLSQIASAQGASVSGPVVRHAFNPNLVYRWFVVPGLVGILSLFTALVVTSLSISRERELGTFDQLLVSPTTPLEIIIAKCLPAVLVGCVMGAVMMTAAIVFFRVPFTGSLFWLVLALFLFILSVVGTGLMVSAIAATQQQAILGAFALGVPMILLSGFATPVENMPEVLRWVAQGVPLTHFLVIVQGSFMKALPLEVIADHLWPMALIALVSLGGATALVKSRLN